MVYAIQRKATNQRQLPSRFCRANGNHEPSIAGGLNFNFISIRNQHVVGELGFELDPDDTF